MSNSATAPRCPVLLVIMDGIGINPSRDNNAVAMAATPNLDAIYAANSTTVIEASGLPVGLPAGQMGNSEVGHLTLGAGSRLRQDLVKINDAISDGSFAANAVFNQAMERAEKNGGRVHLLGLVSDGGVHSHLDHLLALIDLCARRKVVPVVHMITDGRDTAPQSSSGYLTELNEALANADGHIASVCGRYFAMDRDNRWERVEKAWRLLIEGQGDAAGSAEDAIRDSWEAGKTDEFIEPTVLSGYQVPSSDDEWIFYNFRNDRPRELATALTATDFSEFERGEFAPVRLSTMTRYHADYDFPIAFEKEEPATTLGEVVSAAGLSQLRVAETEKYPHVTFFFNGGREQPMAGEERLLVDSPKVATYDLQPSMSAYAIRDGVLAALQRDHSVGKPELIVVNFANGDMVGHTGVAKAVVEAVEVVDECVSALVECAVENGYSVVLTADHGNADMLIDPQTGGPHTKHTIFPVVCTIIDKSQWQLANAGDLTCIAPTVLQLMGLDTPEAMTGTSLLLEEVPAVS